MQEVICEYKGTRLTILCMPTNTQQMGLCTWKSCTKLYSLFLWHFSWHTRHISCWCWSIQCRWLLIQARERLPGDSCRLSHCYFCFRPASQTRWWYFTETRWRKNGCSVRVDVIKMELCLSLINKATINEALELNGRIIGNKKKLQKSQCYD